MAHRKTERNPLFAGRWFEDDIILLCLRWSFRFKLSYRDLVEILGERGLSISHTTILRWVVRYAETCEKRWRRFERPAGGSWRVDETFIKVREAGRIVSVAVIIVVGVNTAGAREVLGMQVGACEAETFWTQFLRSLSRRGLRGGGGGNLVISDSHEGIRAAVQKVLKAIWQRCRAHFLRNALAHAGKGQRQMVRATINTIFAQDTRNAASRQWRIVADQLREKFPKLAAQMDDTETDVLAFMNFPKAHRTQTCSTNPMERLNGEIKRRTNVVGILQNEQAVVRLVCPLLLEQNGEWQIQRRYMQLEGLHALSDNQQACLSVVAQ